MLAYTALLFVVLTPGVLLRLPMKGSKMTVALTHGAIFAVVWYFTHQMVLSASYEGFQGVKKPVKGPVKGPVKMDRTSMNSPPVQAAQEKVQNAEMTLNAIQEKYNQAAQVATDIENDLRNAQQNLKNAEQQLRAAQGLPQTAPIRAPSQKVAR